MQKRILIVDDDREIRDLLSRFLEKQGLRVTAAREAREARRVWPLGRYHLVILDSPPIMRVADAVVLAQHSDAVLFAVGWERTSRTVVMEAMRRQSAKRARSG